MKDTHKLVPSLIEILFSAEERRIDAIIANLTQKNNEARKQYARGFKYQGNNYVPLEYKKEVRGAELIKLPTLSYQLGDIPGQFALDLKTVNQDKQIIGQLLVQLIGNCTTKQEVRNTLPECLVNLIPALKNLPRTQPQILPNNPLFVRQYNKILPKIEFYTACQMLY